MNATTKVSYDPSNFAALAPIEERAAELMNRAKDGAAMLKKKILGVANQGADLTSGFQVVKPDGSPPPVKDGQQGEQSVCKWVEGLVGVLGEVPQSPMLLPLGPVNPLFNQVEDCGEELIDFV